jgi:excisionase family DNA binding protein
MEPLLTPGEVSDYLGVPTGTLANWRYTGRGPTFTRLGRHVRYRATDVAAWVNDHASRTA